MTDRKPVRMNIEPLTHDADDEAAHVVGRFCRKAREQGWSGESIDWATRGMTAAQVADRLRPHIEPAEPDSLSWNTQFERLRDYGEGFRVLYHDQDAVFHPLRFYLRGFWLAIRRST